MAQARDPIYGTIEVVLGSAETATFAIPGSGKYSKLAIAVPDHANWDAGTPVALNGMVPGASSGGTAMDPKGVVNGATGNAWRVTKDSVNVLDFGVPMGRDWELVLKSRAHPAGVTVVISFALFGHTQRCRPND